jgi:flavin-dependent dehydrogenase
MRAVVVGGGLAGAVAALWLRHAGVEVHVLEMRPRPGTTLCGEGLSAKSLRLLAPVFDARPYIDGTFRGARWAFPGTRLSIHETCHTMAREAWIPAMLEQAERRGATVEYGTKVRRGALAALREEYDFVVACDGPGSAVRMDLGYSVRLRLGLQFRLETDRTTPWLEFVTSKRYSNEYAWWFPRSGTHNVGILGEGDGQDWPRLERFCRDMELDGRVVQRQSYPIAYGGRRFASPDGRVLLLGDAAGLTNPLTKGGIAAILHAAPILARHVGRGDGRGYERELHRHALTDASFARALAVVRRWPDSRFEAVLRPAPRELHVGAPALDDGAPHAQPQTASAVRAAAIRVLARRPHLLWHLRVMRRAARGSLACSW